MALLTFLPDKSEEAIKHPPKSKRKKRKQAAAAAKPPSSWDQFKNLLTCKQIADSKIHDPSKHHNIYSSCSSICTFRDANTRVVHRADNSPDGSSTAQETQLLSKKSAHGSSSRSAASARSAPRGIQLRKLSGCYECHAILDPARYPLPRTTICACSECGEVFPKLESLEHHQAVRHAVCELGAEDSSRNIVEIIFKSSWLKKDNPICKIDRILKVQNTQRTIQRFEDYRDAVKSRAAAAATKRSARCAADGNELLRFFSSTLTCSLGARGSSSLCAAIPACGVCTVIRHGFHGAKSAAGIRTTASSGRAHDSLASAGRRAMLVCRVIAGRVKRDPGEDDGDGDGDGTGSYDSVSGGAGVYSNMEELNVFSSRAILPCFVVIYKALE